MTTEENKHSDTYNWTIEQRLANELRQLVISGEFEPGARLQYRDLAQRFGVSTTPVRAALRDLGNEGLVVVTPNVGARVAELSLDELEEVYLARIGYEPWLARIGAPQLTDEQVSLMGEGLADLGAAAKARNADATLDAGWRLRVICYRAAGRTRILDRAQTLFNRARRYNRTTLLTRARFAETEQSSVAFFEACEAREGMAASEVIRIALQNSFDDIAKQLDSSFSQG